MIQGDTPANLDESEPPHIKNWFSSYEYESFVLETNENFGFSDDQGSQGCESDHGAGDTLKLTENSRELVTNEKNNNVVLIISNQSEEENKCHKQVLESSDSPVLSPEPPGIENWFSSYVYESPEVDTIDDLILSDHKESMVECNKKAKMETFKCDDGFLSKKGSEKDENMCVTPDDLNCKQTPEFDNSTSKTKEFENDEKFCITSNEVVCKQTSICDNATLNTKEFPKDENLYITPDDLVCKQTSKYDSSSAKDDNGSRKLEEPGDGFVSIKSKKQNNEKSNQVNGMDRKRCVVSSGNKLKKKSDERVTLGDVTNILGEHSSVTGKWKCPRKRKPDLGPPLKQLRLGQWFHHV